MPDFTSAAGAPDPIKLLYLGDTGAGKTGSLVALAALGYQVRVLDLDNGTEIIRDLVTNPRSPYLQARPGLWTAEAAKGLPARISAVKITEGANFIQGQVVPKGDTWVRIMNQLNKWKDGEKDYGNVGTWGPDTVLAFDGLSRLAGASLNAILGMNGRLGKRPEQSDWGVAQTQLDNLLTFIYSAEIKCHVVMVCHVKYIEGENKLVRGYPQTIGAALSPTVGQRFNHALMARSSGQGTMVKRKILTNTTGVVELKTSAPFRVKPEYDLETGLAEYWRDILGEGNLPGRPKAGL